MNKKNYIWDYIFILLVISISGWMTSYDSLVYGRLYWDNAKFFSIFRDNLQALNYFGEIAWWFPHESVGWPAYYYSILGDLNAASPIFVLIGFLCWLLGRVGFCISEYFTLYVYYTSYFVPLALTVGAYVLSRQIFSSRIVHFFIIILSAFSPGVVLNLSDVGLSEVAAYSMFFFAAYINFFKKPNLRSYYLLLVASMIICLTINFPFTLWNAIAIPLFVVLVSCVNLKHLKKVAGELKIVAWWHYALGAGLITIALIPCFSAFLQGGDLVRSSIGDSIYALENIKPGNPIEFFTTSIPGFGFEWRFMNYKWCWMYLPFGNYHLSINYLGILSLPLMLLGLIYGSRIIRIPLLLMIMIASAVVVLGSASPVLSLLLSIDSPLRSNNHFSDLFFRSGGFLLIIFSAALGLNTLMKCNMKIRIFFMATLAVSSVTGMAIHFYYNKTQCFYSPIFGEFAVVLVLFMVLLLNYFRGRKKIFLYAILALTFIDLSTFTDINVKKFKFNKGDNFFQISEEPNRDNIGLLNAVPGCYAGSIIINKNLKAIQNEKFLPLQRLSRFSLSGSFHASSDMKEEISQYNQGKNYKSLPLSENDISKPEFNCFAGKLNSSEDSRAISGSIDIVRQSYNQLELKIKSSGEGVLFIRDEYSPYWKAWLNDKRTDIARAFFNFKAVVIPGGESTLLLKFEPPYIGFFMLIAYVSIIVIAVVLIGGRNKKEGKTS